MNTIKEKQFHEAQEYIASHEWQELKKDIDTQISESRDFIVADLLVPQSLVYSRNMLRGKTIELVNKYIEKIHNEHLQKVLKVCLVDDSEERACIPTQVSEDIIAYSEKDWVRRERRILEYISGFDKVYWQDSIPDDNVREGWQKSIEEWIFI